MAHKNGNIPLLSGLFILGLLLALPILILGGANASSAKASASYQAPTSGANQSASLRTSTNAALPAKQKGDSSVDGGFTPTSTSTVTPTPTRTNTTGPTATPTTCGVNSNYAIATGTATIVAGTFDTGNHTDEGTTFVTLPFSFRLYDQSFTGVNLSPNGTAEFNSAIGEYQNQCLPSALMPTYSIYVNWDDQRTDMAGKGIYTSVTGVAPNRIYNIEWRTDYFDGGEANYELRLYETSVSGQFDIIYGFVGLGNSNATAGVQKNSTLYTQWFCNQSGGVPSMNRLLTFTQVACGSVTPSPTRTNTATNTPVIPTSTPTRTNTAGPTSTATRTSTTAATNTSTSTPTSTPVIPTQTPTATETNTSVPTSTNTSTNTPTSTSTNTPTNTDTPLPTQTPGGFTATLVPTNTITNTPLPPTATSTATNTSVPSTSTNTPLPATATPTNTSLPTNTSGPGITSTPSATFTPTSTAVAASPTSTTCTLQFTDVPTDHTFYASIRCLACRGIINGYTSGCDTGIPCFRPGTNVTRAQLAKIVSNSAGFTEPTSTQQFTDVPPSSTFFDYIWRLANRGYIAGYPCGGPGEPCDSSNRPYFRPNSFITRGQISKIVANAAGFTEPAGAQQFQDVAPGSTFFDYIWRLANRSIMSGYLCGGPGEPCVGPSNLPYFRPANNATRGQASKIVANTFFPSCDTPQN